jgi:hypothetical protein
LAFQADVEIAGLAGNFLQFGEGVNIDVAVPADLDQLGGNDSHGAVIGGEGLVQLGHNPANSRPFFHQVDIISGVGQIQGGLHPGDAAPDHHY